MHPAAVAGHALPDALPRLDFSPSGKPSGRASRLARSFAFALWARLHDAVSLFAAARRGPGRARVGRNGAPHAVRTYFRRSEQQNGGKKCFRHYLQWLIVVDGKQQILLAQRARQGPWVDPRALPG